MDIVYFSNEFPRDDLQSIFRRLHSQSKTGQHRFVAQFIHEATYAVKDEIRRLPTELKRIIPAFDSILSWAEEESLRNGLICGAVDGVLLVVAQVSVYIAYLEDHPEEVPSANSTVLTALGVGLLSSAAVSLASSPATLPLTGADAVRVAFRMGIHVQGISETLEARDLDEVPDPWAYVVHNIQPSAAQNELDSIHAKESIPETGKIFVSAVSRTSVTVSGPPSRLKALFNKSEFFRATRSIPLPVFGGLCHAPHIYGPSDTDSIVHGSVLGTVSNAIRVVQPVFSTGSGSPYAATTAAQLFESIVTELLTQAICWDNVVAGVVDQAKASSVLKVGLACFGNSVPLSDLGAALKNISTQVEVVIRDFMAAQPPSPDSAPRGSQQSKLAIVGMSCRLPGGATDAEKFWHILEQGLDVSREIPADRFDIGTHYDATGKELNKSMTKYGCFIDEPGMFDAPFFNMSPREAQITDPQMRLALVTAYEALEQSGYVGNRTASTRAERVGTYYGQAADDYREVNQGQEVSTYYIPGGCRAFGPGRINYFFKFSGPSYSIDTACSSGLAAVEVACQALWSGAVDTAITGGLNILTNPDGFAGLCNGHFLTKGHNACKTWDATADGYCRADGVVSFVIKRLDDAEADNDRILGVILGAGTNHSANAVSITHPHAGHQAYLARKVLREADVDPLDVSYIELHGTGTQAGDHEEMQGIMEVYAPLVKRRSKDQPLYIGAVKSNVGHGESVAGATSLYKVLLMLQKNAIPKHIGIKTEINPRFPKDFDKRNLHIAFEQTSWTSGKKRLAVVNSFGAAGGNTTVVLEEAPVRVSSLKDHRQIHVITASAKTKASLTANIERLVDYLDAHTDTNIADLAYSTTARRYQHALRVAVSTSDVSHLRSQLTSRLGKVDVIKPVGKSVSPSIAFTFTGQGASYKSMSLELYRDVPLFREQIQILDSLAQGQGFPSFIPAIDGSNPKEHAHSPVITQLALVCTEIALAKYWGSLGVKPDVVIGHSLGEYAAMHVAGVTSVSDTIFMVGRRAQMLEEKCQIGSHTMMAVRASLASIKESNGGRPFTVACINGPSDTVLSGTKEQMDDVAVSLEAAGFRCIKLDVAFAFHSEQTDPVLDEFEAVAKSGVVFHEPKLPVISPLLGKVIFDGKTLNAKYVRRATRETVDFLSALRNAEDVSTISDETIFIEIGPHPICTGFVKSTLPSVRLAVPSMRRGEDNWKTLADSMSALYLAGVDLSWNELHRPFEQDLRLLDLPTYSWNEKNYWLQYQGDWCLTKGNNFYTKSEDVIKPGFRSLPPSEISTSTVQAIVAEAFEGPAGTVVMQSDLMQPDFLAAAHGHRMNDCGVVTSSIHADIAYTLGEYLLKKLRPKAKEVRMNIVDLVVSKGLVANGNTKVPQVIQVTASTSDIQSNMASLKWQSVDNDGNVNDEPFATAEIHFGSPAEWLASWSGLAHLIRDRIESLDRLAIDGMASRFTHNMAYTLFASNLVDYHDKYRGMQSVVMHDFEAYADVQLTTKESGHWTVAPYFIDSVAHLAGFVMNCTDAHDVATNFCVTPGWRSMRFARPLIAGGRYRSYVRMIPTAEDPSVFFGDVYILQDGEIIGLVGGIQFRRYPRILLSRFFAPPDKVATGAATALKPTAVVPKPLATAVEPKLSPNTASSRAAASTPAPTPAPVSVPQKVIEVPSVPTTVITPPASDIGLDEDSVTAKALRIVAKEGGLEMSDLEDDVGFADLGVDSLMSLVISEKFRSELGVSVSGSLFLDYPTIGDMKNWLMEYYS